MSDITGECADGFTDNEDEVEFRHAGSTLLTFDANNDGYKELVVGDLSSDSLIFLTNGGDCDTAWFIDQTAANFPEAGNPVAIPFFLASFYLDLNNDGENDILAAPKIRVPSGTST